MKLFKNLIWTVGFLPLWLISPNVQGGALQTYWPMHVGDHYTMSSTSGNATTTYASGDGGYPGALKVTTVVGSLSSVAHIGYSGGSVVSYDVVAGGVSTVYSPALLSITESALATQGSFSGTSHFTVSGASASVTISGTVSAGGSVTVPAGTFNNCLKVVETMTTTTTVMGQSISSTAQMTFYLAPNVGAVKSETVTTVPGVPQTRTTSVLVSGVIGGVDVTKGGGGGTTDKTPPSVVIATPTPGQRILTNGSIVTVRGTAADNVGVDKVFCQINGGTFDVVTGTKAWTNVAWVVAGTNVLRAYAVDASGNCSRTSSVAFVIVQTSALSVSQTGAGTILPAMNNMLLEIGRNYSIKAVPAAGQIFSNWVANGAVVTNNPNLVFKMRPNLQLTANFVTNRFIADKGDYQGIFTLGYESTDWTNSGALKLTLTDKGSYTGQLLNQGKSYPLSGAFNAAGYATNWVARGTQPALRVRIKVEPDSLGMYGDVGPVGGWQAGLMADRKVVAKTNAFQGTYVITDTNNLGTLTIKVAPTGVTTTSGKLSDGTAVALTTGISVWGDVPLYQPLYANKGMLLGYFRCKQGAGGELYWQKLPTTLNPSGFTKAAVFTVQQK
ncbi:MAG: Ig-like domain-containing protein [Verrucomicrobiota bacterium]